MKSYRVAVVGATGMVGSTMIRVLQQRGFPVRELCPLATARSAGTEVAFQGKPVVVRDIQAFDFRGVDLALFAGGEIASEEHVPRARKAGVVVVDNSSAYRTDPQVPLVVPEVNAEALRGHRGLVANPNCSTIQMVVALAPLHRAAGLRRVSVATYQSVSGTGKEALEELEEQVRCWAQGQEPPEPRVYPRPIAFNLFPDVGSPADADGYTGEERKMMAETRKILGLPELRITATCVRVPVRFAHAEAVQVETERPLSPEEARRALEEAPGLRVLDGYPTPLEGRGQDLVLVGRIRRDSSVDNGLHLWVVADNLRKGAATNAVQIAERLLEMELLRPRAAGMA